MAKAKPTAAPAASVPAVKAKTGVGPAFDFSNDAGAGFEGAGATAYAIPFLSILQSGSPQCKRADPAYIKGATEGMIYNTVTNEIFNGDEGIEIIPCAFTNTFVEWGLREKGGGFVAEYDGVTGAGLRTKARRDDKGRDILPSGNHIGDHRNHYVLYKDGDGNWQPALMSLTSTGIKASRNWMSVMRNETAAHKAPMFGLRFLLTSVAQTNDKGTWYGPTFASVGFAEDEETYAKAKAFHESVKSGGVKAPTRDSADPAGDGAVDNADEM